MTVKYGEILRLASKGYSRRNIALSVPCSLNVNVVFVVVSKVSKNVHVFQ